jgi:cytochrome c5
VIQDEKDNVKYSEMELYKVIKTSISSSQRLSFLNKIPGPTPKRSNISKMLEARHRFNFLFGLVLSQMRARQIYGEVNLKSNQKFDSYNPQEIENILGENFYSVFHDNVLRDSFNDGAYNSAKAIDALFQGKSHLANYSIQKGRRDGYGMEYRPFMLAAPELSQLSLEYFFDNSRILQNFSSIGIEAMPQTISKDYSQQAHSGKNLFQQVCLKCHEGDQDSIPFEDLESLKNFNINGKTILDYLNGDGVKIMPPRSSKIDDKTRAELRKFINR